MQDLPIYDLLKRDHESVTELLRRVKAARGDEARDLLAELAREVTAHARAEEAVFYGHLLHNERTRARILESLQDHEQIDARLGELALMQPHDERWSARLDVLSEDLGQHIDEEENQLFPLARQILSDREAVEFGRRFAAERERHIRDQSGLDAAE